MACWFCCYGNVNLENSATFCFWYLYTRCGSSTTVSVVNMHVCFFPFEICFEKGAFRQIQDSVMVVLPW